MIGLNRILFCFNNSSQITKRNERKELGKSIHFLKAFFETYSKMVLFKVNVFFHPEVDCSETLCAGFSNPKNLILQSDLLAHGFNQKLSSCIR